VQYLVKKYKRTAASQSEKALRMLLSRHPHTSNEKKCNAKVAKVKSRQATLISSTNNNSYVSVYTIYS